MNILFHFNEIINPKRGSLLLMEKENEGKIELLGLQTELCKPLSDPKRLRIIKELRSGERTVTKLANLLGLIQSNYITAPWRAALDRCYYPKKRGQHSPITAWQMLR